MTMALPQKFVYLVTQWQIEYPQPARQIEHVDVVYNARLHDEGHIGSEKSIGSNLPTGHERHLRRMGCVAEANRPPALRAIASVGQPQHPLVNSQATDCQPTTA